MKWNGPIEGSATCCSYRRLRYLCILAIESQPFASQRDVWVICLFYFCLLIMGTKRCQGLIIQIGSIIHTSGSTRQCMHARQSSYMLLALQVSTEVSHYCRCGLHYELVSFALSPAPEMTFL